MHLKMEIVWCKTIPGANSWDLMIPQKAKKTTGKTLFCVIGGITPPNPYKTCRLWRILRATVKNATQKA